MICTEEEARKKWCPMVRMSLNNTADGSSYNRLRDDKKSVEMVGFCIASGCMLWQPTSLWKDLGACGLGAKP